MFSTTIEIKTNLVKQQKSVREKGRKGSDGNINARQSSLNYQK